MAYCAKCGKPANPQQQFCIYCGARQAALTNFSAADDPSKPLYFQVSQTKLIVMSLLTFGIYDIYWFYKNWKLIKETTGQNIRPFWRAVFGAIFCYPLFKSIKETANANGIHEDINPGLFTGILISFNLLSRLPDPYWMLSILFFVPLVKVQSVVNEINLKMKPQAGLNDRFTGNTIIAIISGILFWILVIYGMTLPD